MVIDSGSMYLLTFLLAVLLYAGWQKFGVRVVLHIDDVKLWAWVSIISAVARLMGRRREKFLNKLNLMIDEEQDAQQRAFQRRVMERVK